MENVYNSFRTSARSLHHGHAAQELPGTLWSDSSFSPLLGTPVQSFGTKTYWNPSLPFYFASVSLQEAYDVILSAHAVSN